MKVAFRKILNSSALKCVAFDRQGLFGVAVNRAIIRRIAEDALGFDARHQMINVFAVGGIAAEQLMAVQIPFVATLGDRRLRKLGQPRFHDFDHGFVPRFANGLAHRFEQIAQIVFVVSRTVQGILRP